VVVGDQCADHRMHRLHVSEQHIDLLLLLRFTHFIYFQKCKEIYSRTKGYAVSVEAITWAFQQPVPHASAKFVLVAMANHADADMRCWPSSTHLCSQTAQDRKTVQTNLQRLRDWGYIVDTGERRGATKQVPVYQLKQPENGPVKGSTRLPKDDVNTTENGLVLGKDLSTNSTGLGLVINGEEAQKRAVYNPETGPNFPPNRPVFPHKQAQISPETGPKTGHGTIRNHQGTINEPTRAREAIELPAWLPRDAWFNYLEMRRAKNKAPTGPAVGMILADLSKWRDAGHDVVAVLNASTKNGWTDVYEPKPVPAGTAAPHTPAAQATPPAPPRNPRGNEPKGTDESYDEWQTRVDAFERAQRGRAA
jgi:hypothetical protein